MIACVPRIYPDELFYGYLARCYVYNAYLRFADFAEDWLPTKKQSVSVEFLSKLSNEADSLISQSDDFQTLLHRHTLFDYYYAFTRRCLFPAQDIILPELTDKNDIFSFRYCPYCAAEDRKYLGEAYWHVTHQFPEINGCLRHNSELLSSQPYRYKILRSQLIIAEKTIPTEPHNRVRLPEKLRQIYGFVVNSVHSAPNSILYRQRDECFKTLNMLNKPDLYHRFLQFYWDVNIRLPSFTEFTAILNKENSDTFYICLILFAKDAILY